jgi:hypothetical protein
LVRDWYPVVEALELAHGEDWLLMVLEELLKLNQASGSRASTPKT